MKKFYLILLLATGLCNGQIVNIPDLNFKAKLLSALPTNYVARNLSGINFKIDANNDGEIQVTEAQNVLGLQIFNAGISDLTGIDAFSNMTSLVCGGNPLGTLNLNSNPELKSIDCNTCQLSSLALSSLTNLENLDVSYNQLTSIDLAPFAHLKNLGIKSNQLVGIDFTGLLALETVDVANNQLIALNVNFLSHLRRLKLENNLVTSLDLNGMTSLIELNAWNNRLATVDFGPNTNIVDCGLYNNLITNITFGPGTRITNLGLANNLIQFLDFSQALINDPNDFNHITLGQNPITEINIKNGEVNSSFIIYLNNLASTLRYLCLDENEMGFVLPSLSNVLVNSYCSFTPGGHYNTIAGTVKFDAANDGCDSADSSLPYIKVAINDGVTAGSSLVDATGNYYFYTQAGNFTLMPSIENPQWFNFSPTMATTAFADNNDHTTVQDFCLTANGFHPDIEILIFPLEKARPGFDAHYEIIYRNKGNYTYANGLLNLQFDDAVMDYVSASQNPMTQSVGSIHWEFINLRPFESRQIELVLNINGPMETPPVNIDDLLSFTASSFPSEVDETPEDNSFTYHQTVTGSFDPNDKTCLEGDVISAEHLGKYLHYNINFENTGTAAAENIVVKDLIDTSKFDISSLQILDAPNATSIRVSDNKLEVIFENIQLAPAAHGHVLFKIKTKPDLPIGTSVSNQASIYFDYNFPIQTNTATSTFQLLGNPSFNADASVTVYPNPTSNRVSVSAAGEIKSVGIYDLQGRVIQSRLVHTKADNIDLSAYQNGVYFFKVQTDTGSSVQKIIKK